MTDMIRVGNVEIVAVLDMVPPPRDPTIFIREQPREAWAPYEDEVPGKRHVAALLRQFLR